MSAPTQAPPLPVAAEETPAEKTAFTEAILDNLSAWTVIAASVGLLYLVWATLEIMSHYVGGIPKVTP